MKKLSRFIFGALLGGFFGSALILLFTPESGEKTREAFQYRFSGLADQIKDAINSRKEELLEEIEKYNSTEK